MKREITVIYVAITIFKTFLFYFKCVYFITGVGDTVKCFTCGGGLKDWEPEDMPCVEHASWFPRCEYLAKLKGHEFIHHIQDLKKTMVRYICVLLLLLLLSLL